MPRHPGTPKRNAPVSCSSAGNVRWGERYCSCQNPRPKVAARKRVESDEM